MNRNALIAGVVMLLVLPWGSSLADGPRIPDLQQSADPVRDRTYTVSPLEFVAVRGVTAITTDYPSLRRRVTGSERGAWLYAPLHLPDGAFITGISFEYCNETAPGEAGVTIVSHVNGQMIEAPPGSGLPNDGPPNSCSSATAVIKPFPPIDNAAVQLSVQMTLLGGAVAERVAFGPVRIHYRLYPAPAPEVPSFGDVPVTHPFYRFIEALYASGATVGCGGGNYCPDAPVTRAQVAAMLARAFGLGW